MIIMDSCVLSQIGKRESAIESFLFTVKMTFLFDLSDQNIWLKSVRIIDL